MIVSNLVMNKLKAGTSSNVLKFKPLFSSIIKKFVCVCDKSYLLMIRNLVEIKISFQLFQPVNKFFLKRSPIIE